MSAKDRAAIVTGAGSGIGKATAEQLARHGYGVVVSDIDAAAAAATVDGINAEVEGCAVSVVADVGEPETGQLLVDTALAKFGRLDAAVNNAATSQRYQPGIDDSTLICNMSLSEWRRVMTINLDGMFLCLGAQVRAMRSLGRGGSIVNVSSTAALAALEGMAAYVSSKMGVVGLTRTAAIELAREGIRVNAVLPGYVATEMLAFSQGRTPEAFAAQNRVAPMGRPGTPAEVAQAIVWLCGPESSYVTGIDMPVEGGGSARHPRSQGPK